jgi:hypothetical protein
MIVNVPHEGDEGARGFGPMKQTVVPRLINVGAPALLAATQQLGHGSCTSQKCRQLYQIALQAAE